MAQNRLHRSVQLTALPRLDAQTIGKVPGEKAGRLQFVLQCSKYILRLPQRAPGGSGNCGQRPVQPAIAVQRLDKGHGERLIRPRCGNHTQLRHHMRVKTIRRAALFAGFTRIASRQP